MKNSTIAGFAFLFIILLFAVPAISTHLSGEGVPSAYSVTETPTPPAHQQSGTETFLSRCFVGFLIVVVLVLGFFGARALFRLP
jgi:hypothetical protein